jgi:hypothetical protein
MAAAERRTSLNGKGTGDKQMTIKNGERGTSTTQIRYHSIRNVTSNNEKENNVQTFIANVPADQAQTLGTEANLRSYIAEYSDRKRNGVHRAIENTIKTEPDRFINRNGGLTIACSQAEIDDAKKIAKLKNASLINGAQTQGEIRRFFDEIKDPNTGEIPEDLIFDVRVEINVDPDPASVTETAIARNTATAVKSISQAGARGQLDDLAAAIAAARPGAKIRTSETEVDVIETHQLLQYTRLLMPKSVSQNDVAAELLRPYKNKAQCLSDFSEWYTHKGSDDAAERKYRFTVQMAPIALAEYEYWLSHDAWNGQRIWTETKKGGRAVRRDNAGKIDWLAPGIMFPLIGALSAFVVEHKPGKWRLEKPRIFKPAELVHRTVNQFRAHNSDPMWMGRSAAAYEALRTYTETIIAVLNDAKNGRGNDM